MNYKTEEFFVKFFSSHNIFLCRKMKSKTLFKDHLSDSLLVKEHSNCLLYLQSIFMLFLLLGKTSSLAFLGHSHIKQAELNHENSNSELF